MADSTCLIHYIISIYIFKPEFFSIFAGNGPRPTDPTDDNEETTENGTPIN